MLIRGNTQLLSGGDIFGEVQLTPGGSAANTAVWARRCGQATRFVGKIGNDRFGRIAMDELADEGVQTDWVHSDAHLTGSVAVWTDHEGQRSMVSGKGADHYLLPSELPLTTLRRAAHLHLSAWSFFGDPPRAAARRAAAVAKEAGATLSFDPGSFQMIQEMGAETFVALTADMGIDVLFPNAEEGEVLTGETEPGLVAGRLAELYPGALIVLKLDADGSYLLDAGTGTHHAPAPGRLVDATGAGDAYAGVFLAAWLSGVPATEAAALANRVSAWVIERVGARPVADDALLALLSEAKSAALRAAGGADRAGRPARRDHAG